VLRRRLRRGPDRPHHRRGPHPWAIRAACRCSCTRVQGSLPERLEDYLLPVYRYLRRSLRWGGDSEERAATGRVDWPAAGPSSASTPRISRSTNICVK